MNKVPDDETMQQQRQFDKDRKEATEEIFEQIWHWEAYAMMAAETARDFLELMERPLRDVAICWLRKIT